MATRMQEMVGRLAGLSGVVLIAASVAGLVSTQLQDEARCPERIGNQVCHVAFIFSR